VASLGLSNFDNTVEKNNALKIIAAPAGGISAAGLFDINI
jgi:hypothetical protein